jgi:tripartite-type tricarboxylate transporter receptor subunit TctC
MIVARRDFPAKDLQEFVSYVKANAEKLNMGHAGCWTSSAKSRTRRAAANSRSAIL